MANYVSKHTGAQIDAAVDKTGELDGKVATLSEEMSEQSVTPQMFGAVADGVADDSDAIQTALNKGGMVYLPAGRYKITKTLTIGSNTTMMGAGDNSVIFLGDGGENLTPHDWYIDSTTYPKYYPYITTAEGASRIKISRIRVEGNVEKASTNMHVGICAESASDVSVEHVSVWKINYFPELAPARPSGQWRRGWNVAFLRCNRVELAHSVVQYGAYECVRIGTRTNNVWVHDCLIEYGWRTGLQIIEACNDVLVERCTINQDDFDAYDTNACITLHASDVNHIGDVVIRGCKLTGKLFTGSAGGAGISDVGGWVDNLVVEDTTIDIDASGLPSVVVFSSATFRRCKVISAAYTAIEATAKDDMDVFVFEDTEFAASPTTNKPAVSIWGRAAVDRCNITSTYDCIKIMTEAEYDRHIRIANCNLNPGNDGNSLTFWVAAERGGVTFDILDNMLNGTIYISQPTKVMSRKCEISGNTIVVQSGKACVQNDYSSTSYGLLLINNNVMTGGSNAVKIFGAGVAIIKDNDMSGCTNGIQATNAKNVVKDNILPVTN
jgi:hypothetical protein